MLLKRWINHQWFNILTLGLPTTTVIFLTGVDIIFFCRLGVAGGDWKSSFLFKYVPSLLADLNVVLASAILRLEVAKAPAAPEHSWHKNADLLGVTFKEKPNVSLNTSTDVVSVPRSFDVSEVRL